MGEGNYSVFHHKDGDLDIWTYGESDRPPTHTCILLGGHGCTIGSMVRGVVLFLDDHVDISSLSYGDLPAIVWVLLERKATEGVGKYDSLILVFLI